MVRENPKLSQDEPRHPIQVVARRTGLTADVIRAWERRHGAVAPRRSPTSRRLYSDTEVERLLLLRRATMLGRRIGDVAKLASTDLAGLVEADEAASTSTPQPRRQTAEDPLAQGHLGACLDAVRALDAARLESILSSAALVLSSTVLIEQVVVPLMRSVGDGWREGSIRVSQEHLATVLVRSLLSTLRATLGRSNQGPDVVVTTPTGQLHELGALVAAVTAASAGWRVTYLGPSLPADEIAAAAAQRKARAVALSIVHPPDDPRLEDELRELRRRLPKETVLLVGGAAAPAYARVLREAGALRVDDMPALRSELEALR